MEFRDLKVQYIKNKEEIDSAIQNILNDAHFIGGESVSQLEKKLADFVGVKHCITCANGTDALLLALMAWNIGEKDAVFVPDFTFFSTAEVVPWVKAVPVFVDVDKDTFNIDPQKLEESIKETLNRGQCTPKAIIAVDLFGQPADYPAIRQIAEKYNLYLLEDGAQGFGGAIGKEKACSFGDISTTSFFPAKPLGCYGDGGAVFTDNDEWAQKIRSLAVHGKGRSKYDNVQIGMNSRLDSIQAAVLLAKLPVFIMKELEESNRLARIYTEQLEEIVKVPVIKDGYYSGWAQYTIRLKNAQGRQELQEYMKLEGIPTAIYYQKPIHRQAAFAEFHYADENYMITNELCETVLSLPFYPYMEVVEIEKIAKKIKEYLK